MGRLPLGIYIELISRRPQPEWYVLRLDIQTLKYIQLILKHGKYKEHSLPDGRESFNVWFSVARTFSNISRSSLILEGAVVPCISAAMNGTSSGSRVGYLSVTDIIATLISGTVDDHSKACYPLFSPLLLYSLLFFASLRKQPLKPELNYPSGYPDNLITLKSQFTEQKGVMTFVFVHLSHCSLRVDGGTS